MTDKLIGTGTSGNFVHAHQEMASEAGFKNVSKIWYNKTMSFEDGLASLAEGKAKTQDVLATLAEMKPAIDGEGNFVMVLRDELKFKPTKYALAQMSSWVGCGSYFAQTLSEPGTNLKGEVIYSRDQQDVETLVRVFENGFRRVDQTKKFLFRTRQDGTLRAMLTDKYSMINNEWFLESLMKLIPGGRLSHWKGDSDTIYGNILISDTIRAEVDSEYGGMLSISNCEIGIRRMSSIPSIFRAICMNGCIWDRTMGEAIRKVHRGSINLVELFQILKDNLEKQIPLLPQGIDAFLKTKELKYDGEMKPLFAQIAIENKLPKPQATGLLTAYNIEPSRSLFGVVNAITRMGQKFDNKTWVDMDSLAGKLVSSPVSWPSIVNKAKLLKVKEVDAMFAQAA